jgi:hypothetical protein
MVRQVLHNQEIEMTLAGNLASTITSLTAEVNTQATAINALVAEDGVVVAALNDLLTKSTGGQVADVDVQAAIDTATAAITAIQQATATIQTQVSQVDAAVQADDPSVEPSVTT